MVVEEKEIVVEWWSLDIGAINWLHLIRFDPFQFHGVCRILEKTLLLL